MPSRTLNSSNDRASSFDNASELSYKNRMMSKKMKEVEEVIRAKLKSMWISVRKAFLDLDDD